MYSQVQSSRLYEQIVNQIETLILEGKLLPGDQLPSERELAEQFHVSRTAVREAVKTLLEKGLVDIQTGRGTFIAEGTNQGMRKTLDWMVRANVGDSQADLVQVREILEPEIAAIAARMATKVDLDALQAAIDTMDAALDDVGAFIEADMAFHLALAYATHNGLIPALINPIVDMLREQRTRIFLVAGGAERGQHHHRRILEALKWKDAVAARAAMEAHLAQVRADSEIEET
jgi:GntR family transcriptional repressor for pyruvate dehydrogenase complex